MDVQRTQIYLAIRHQNEHVLYIFVIADENYMFLDSKVSLKSRGEAINVMLLYIYIYSFYLVPHLFNTIPVLKLGGVTSLL